MHTKSLVATLALVLVPGTVFAQADAGPAPGNETARTHETAWGEKTTTAQPQEIEGRVVEKNAAEGTLEVHLSSGKALTIHATPQQQRNYTKDDVAAIPVLSYQGELWAYREPLAEQAGPTGQERVMTGEVVHVDLGQGVLTLRRGKETRRFRAHPEVLQDLAPGQLVSLTYQDVKDRRWVDELQPNTAPSAETPAPPGTGKTPSK